MWQGLQTITDHKGKHSRELPSDVSLPDKLNYFYARFEASNTETCMRASAVPDYCVITLSAADVIKTFKQVNIHKDICIPPPNLHTAQTDPQLKVEWVESFNFLGVHITNKLSWSTKTIVKRARQNLLPLRRLKRIGMSPQILKKFYCCTIESILTGCITACYGYCSAFDWKALENVVRMAQTSRTYILDGVRGRPKK